MHFLFGFEQARNVKRYDLIMLDRLASWPHPEEYIKIGAEKNLVSVECFQGKFGSRRSLKADASRREFYRALRASNAVQLCKRIGGRTLQCGSRTIEVYQVDPFSSDEVFP